jgi:hypothetical protein
MGRAAGRRGWYSPEGLRTSPRISADYARTGPSESLFSNCSRLPSGLFFHSTHIAVVQFRGHLRPYAPGNADQDHRQSESDDLLGRAADWHNQKLTPNPDALFFMAFFNTKDVGPSVIDVPPAGADGSLNANTVDV